MDQIFRSEAYRSSVANGPTFRVDDFVQSSKLRGGIAIDFGAGVGWLSDRLSRDFSLVHAIEPSVAAQKLAEDCFGIATNRRIFWHTGYAETVLPTLLLPQPAFAVSGAVLSHLSDQQARRICSKIVSKLPVGSEIVFCEAWGDTFMQPMWSVRSEAWWAESLPGFRLDFFGPPTRHDRRQNMGLHAIRF